MPARSSTSGAEIVMAREMETETLSFSLAEL